MAFNRRMNWTKTKSKTRSTESQESAGIVETADSVFLEYSHRFMYISRFITLSDIYFCVLSLKELWRNVRCAGNFIYAFYVPKLC